LISQNANLPGSRYFETEEQYLVARAEEMKDKGLGLDIVGTVEDLKRKVARYYQNGDDM
jgi:hypothetical protein